MAKRQKKKRQKRYRPPDSPVAEQPQVHRFVAETETKKDSRKRFKRRGLLAAVILLPLVLLLWWLL